MKKVIIALFALLALAFSFAFYMGFFHSPDIAERSFGPYYMIYKDHVGSYSKLHPVFEEIEAILEKNKIKQIAMSGIYYDNPQKADEEKLRSKVGALLQETDFLKYKKSLRGTGVSFLSLPKQQYIFAEFPYRNMLSIIAAVVKVYPALGEYVKQKGYPEYEYKEKNYSDAFVLEIYNDDSILFLMKPKHDFNRKRN